MEGACLICSQRCCRCISRAMTLWLSNQPTWGDLAGRAVQCSREGRRLDDARSSPASKLETSRFAQALLRGQRRYAKKRKQQVAVSREKVAWETCQGSHVPCCGPSASALRNGWPWLRPPSTASRRCRWAVGQLLILTAHFTSNQLAAVSAPLLFPPSA